MNITQKVFYAYSVDERIDLIKFGQRLVFNQETIY